SESLVAPLVPASIDEEEILSCVIRHEQVHQAIVIHIGSAHAERLAKRSLEIGAPSGLREGSVAVVVPQHTGRRLEEMGNAVVIVEAALLVLVGAQKTVAQVVPNVAADEKIEDSVVVVVEPYGASGPSR